MDDVLQADLKAAYAADRHEIDAAVRRVLESGWYILGAEVKAFESEFAAWCGVPHAIGVGNGTDAIQLALRAVGCSVGTSVVTVSHTVSATVAAIEAIGATPILIDVEPGSLTMDPHELNFVLEHPPVGLPPIRAVVPVHLYGQPAHINDISAQCRSRGVALVDDCAHAHGAVIGDTKAGTWADASTFSFYPTKNLAGFGDGGMVTTGNAELAESLRAMRQYGWRFHYSSESQGVDSRLDELQAAMLRVRLRKLDGRLARRRAIAADYGDVLSSMDSDIVAPEERSGSLHAFHLYVVRSKDRDGLQTYLNDRGVRTNIHYPQPVHLQPCYMDRVRLGPQRCVESERACKEILTLPLHPEMTDGQVDRVCDALRSYVAERG